MGDTPEKSTVAEVTVAKTDASVPQESVSAPNAPVVGVPSVTSVADISVQETPVGKSYVMQLNSYKDNHRKQNVVFASVGGAVHGGISLGAMGMLANSAKQYVFSNSYKLANGEKYIKFNTSSLNKWIGYTAALGAAIGLVKGAVHATNHNNQVDNAQFAEMLEAQRASQLLGQGPSK